MNEYKKILTSLNISPPAEGTTPSVYFLGIGGIGMSALARYFVSLQVKVSGYDKTETPLSRQLALEGIHIHYEDNVALIDQSAQLVIYTPAVPKDHQELNFYRDNNYTVVKRSDVLGAITNNTYNICVAGTHGKTTTSSMVGHILRHSGFGCNAFLGGISVNYNTNFWPSENKVSVVEADEYDRSFLKLSPDIAIISSMDPDHLDIYGTAENMEQAFIDFSGKIKTGGTLISKHGLKRSDDLKTVNHITYALEDEKADAHAINIRMNAGSYRFDIVQKNDGNTVWQLNDVVLNMGGMHNVENVLAAILVAHHLNISDEAILNAVADYKGVKRRFEYILKSEAVVLIDDYAHHPEELRALISGAKGLFNNRKCTIIFQPHLFSRTRDLATEFAEVLDLSDEVLLLPVYPARELPMEGVSSKLILDRMKTKVKQLVGKEDLLAQIEKSNNTLMIMAGAGDIDNLVEPVSQILLKKWDT